MDDTSNRTLSRRDLLRRGAVALPVVALAAFTTSVPAEVQAAEKRARAAGGWTPDEIERKWGRPARHAEAGDGLWHVLLDGNPIENGVEASEAEGWILVMVMEERDGDLQPVHPIVHERLVGEVRLLHPVVDAALFRQAERIIKARRERRAILQQRVRAKQEREARAKVYKRHPDSVITFYGPNGEVRMSGTLRDLRLDTPDEAKRMAGYLGFDLARPGDEVTINGILVSDGTYGVGDGRWTGPEVAFVQMAREEREKFTSGQWNERAILNTASPTPARGPARGPVGRLFDRVEGSTRSWVRRVADGGRRRFDRWWKTDGLG